MNRVEVAARHILARYDGHVSTHYADCYLYHLGCFARFVLDEVES